MVMPAVAATLIEGSHDIVRPVCAQAIVDAGLFQSVAVLMTQGNVKDSGADINSAAAVKFALKRKLHSALMTLESIQIVGLNNFLLLCRNAT